MFCSLVSITMRRNIILVRSSAQRYENEKSIAAHSSHTLCYSYIRLKLTKRKRKENCIKISVLWQCKIGTFEESGVLIFMLF